MHEWALAESIIATAIQNVEKNNLKTLTSLTIHIGELQQIEWDILKFALEEIMKSYKDQRVKNVNITIETEECILHCNICGHRWSFKEMKKHLHDDEAEAIHFIPEAAFAHARCLKCGSPDFKIIQGRGITLTSITGETKRDG